MILLETLSLATLIFQPPLFLRVRGRERLPRIELLNKRIVHQCGLEHDLIVFIARKDFGRVDEVGKFQVVGNPRLMGREHRQATSDQLGFAEFRPVLGTVKRVACTAGVLPLVQVNNRITVVVQPDEQIDHLDAEFGIPFTKLGSERSGLDFELVIVRIPLCMTGGGVDSVNSFLQTRDSGGQTLDGSFRCSSFVVGFIRVRVSDVEGERGVDTKDFLRCGDGRACLVDQSAKRVTVGASVGCETLGDTSIKGLFVCHGLIVRFARVILEDGLQPRDFGSQRFDFIRVGLLLQRGWKRCVGPLLGWFSHWACPLFAPRILQRFNGFRIRCVLNGAGVAVAERTCDFVLVHFIPHSFVGTTDELTVLPATPLALHTARRDACSALFVVVARIVPLSLVGRVFHASASCRFEIS